MVWNEDVNAPDILDHEQKATDASTAVGPTTSKLKRDGIGQAKSLIVTPSVAGRWRCDGTDPTAAIGQEAAAGTAFQINGAGNVSRFKIINKTGSGTVDLSYGY